MIYADNSASTRISEGALAEMLPCLTEGCANPASGHEAGIFCRRMLEQARQTLSAVLQGAGGTFVFTSGGTEANNLGLYGAASAVLQRGGRILIGASEHASVKEPCRRLEALGIRTEELPTDALGRIRPETLEARMDDRTALVAVMWANNEIGTVQPVAELSRIAHSRGALFFCDAVAAAGHVPVDLRAANPDYLTLSGRKFYGPQGIGALYVRHGAPLRPVLLGGGQENGLRSGTENTAGAVGMAAALREAAGEMQAEAVRLSELAQLALEKILPAGGVTVTGDPQQRIPGLLSLLLEDVEGEAVAGMLSLRHICISAGAACNQGKVRLSDTVRAIGVRESDGRGHVRISFGRYNTPAEALALGAALAEVTEKLRALKKM